MPLVADADTGYGNPINVVRTVREYEQAGVAGLHLEDQVMPKRCGHLAGKVVVPCEDMEAKIRAAVAARTDPDLVIIARTDVAAVEGLDAAIDRARRFADAGADVLFVEAPTSEQDIEKVATALAGHRLVFNWAEGGRTPPLSLERLTGDGLRARAVPRLDAARGGHRDALGARAPARRRHPRGACSTRSAASTPSPTARASPRSGRWRRASPEHRVVGARVTRLLRAARVTLATPPSPPVAAPHVALDVVEVEVRGGLQGRGRARDQQRHPDRVVLLLAQRDLVLARR